MAQYAEAGKKYFEIDASKRRKRWFDVGFSLATLLIGAPVFLILAILVRVTSKGPVVYSSKRVGLHGKEIHCYKFRTMVQDAESRLKEVLAANPTYREEWRVYRKLRSDPRITRIGKFLRKTSLDELPQFFNVLRGDLSIVGPRPVTEEEVRDFYGSLAPIILSVRPGITGLWQTSDRNALSLEERAQLEAQYVRDWSFAKDFFLILKTVGVMVKGSGL